MLRFGHSHLLWALVLVPVLILLFLFVRRWKRRALASLGDRTVISRIIPDVSFKRPTLKFILFIIAFGLMIIGAADPQIGTTTDDTKHKGADIMILLDVSNSMLSQDFAPNRLENAKMAIAQLIDHLKDDRIGIVVFAGEAYVQLPMTNDYSAAKLFLNTINTNMVPVQGTAIGAAIDMGVKSFDFKDGAAKAIVLLTDGENHEDDAVTAATAAHDRGVAIQVIGFGSSQGSPIPIYDDNGKETGFHTDSAGHTVVSKLDENMCREIAMAGGGTYFHASSANSGLGYAQNQINKMARKTYDTKTFKDFEDRFQFFLVLTLALLVIEFFIANRKNERLTRLKLFDVRKQEEEA
jgi:Ca-activated chloride channel family protein